MTILTSAAAAHTMLSLLAGALGFLLWRHQSPVTIARGMSESEVEAALGAPGRRSRDQSRQTWIYHDVHDHRAVVTFRSGRVDRVRFE
ncbi:MAG: hypothetical protein AB7N76_08565 [Planctomycetota bacterium]